MRLNKTMTLEDKQRFARYPLKMNSDYKLPYMEGPSQRYYLRECHLTSENSCFYFSPKLMGVLCLPCVLFAPDTVGKGLNQKVGMLVTKPLTNYKKIKELYKNHITAQFHCNAVIEMKNVLQHMKPDSNGDINRQLRTKLSQEIEKNKKLFKAVLLEIEYCARTNTSIRGHRDSGRIVLPFDEESIDYSQGNLRAALQKRCLFDKELASIMQHCPKNATFLSPTVQNNIIECSSIVMLRKIAAPIIKAGFFSIIADGTSDISRCEQLSLSLRYVSTDFTINEVFVGFVVLQKQTGREIASEILKQLSDLGLSTDNLVAQGYDGASVMTGHTNGVQAVIKESCPQATFVHCFSHCLNLVIRSTSDIREVKSAHLTISDICNYFSHSSVRTLELQKIVEQLKENGSITTNKKRLTTFCPTRFVEGAETIFTFIDLYPALLQFFEERHEINIVNAMSESSFVVTIHLLAVLFGETKGASVQLQSKVIDLVKAVREIERIKARFMEFRTDENDAAYNKAFDSAQILYGDNSISMPRCVSRQRHRNNVPADSAHSFYKRNVWFPLLDQTIEDLNTRFSHSSKIVMEMTNLLPQFCTEADLEKMADDLYDNYSEKLTATKMEFLYELKRWQHTWSLVRYDERPTTITECLIKCDEILFPNTQRILRIFATIPVTSCTAERSFSTLRLIKSFLRSTMGENRLNGLSLLSVHKNIKLDHEEVIQEYARKFDTRLRLT